MIYFDWSSDKNVTLKAERGVGFEDVVITIQQGHILNILPHPNRSKYPNQKIFILEIYSYIYYVPFIESEETIFLKTIIPSRKMTKKYLKNNK